MTLSCCEESWLASQSGPFVNTCIGISCFSIGFKRRLWLSHTELWCVNNFKGWLCRSHTMDSQVVFVPPQPPLWSTILFWLFSSLNPFSVLSIFIEANKTHLRWIHLLLSLKFLNFSAESVSNISVKYKVYAQIWHINFYPKINRVDMKC